MSIDEQALEGWSKALTTEQASEIWAGLWSGPEIDGRDADDVARAEFFAQFMRGCCTKYHRGDHPRIRLTECDLDAQMLALFKRLQVEDDAFRQSFREELRKTTN